MTDETISRTPPVRHFRWVYLRLLKAGVHPILIEPLCPIMERAACIETVLERYVAKEAALANAGDGEGRCGRAERLAALVEARAGVAICKSEIAALFAEGDATVERIKRHAACSLVQE